jgi:hypothetical protein
MKSKSILLALCLILCLLGGCEFKSGDKLLQPPQPSKAYEALQKQLTAITDNGAIAVAPQSGQNRTTVKLEDLDRDGEEEAVAFFCEAKNPSQFHVYLFQKDGDDYVARGEITGTGVQIASVSFPTLLPTGEKGIVISWKLGSDNTSTGMTVCSFIGGKLEILLETTYQSFVACDLDADGADDLVLFTIDASGRRTAQLYCYSRSKMTLRGETTLAPEVQAVVSLKTGNLRGYQKAVFAEGKPELGTGLMTDILIYDADGFRNIALEGEDSADQGTYRPVSVPSTDVNGDRLTEVPRAVAMPGTAASDAIYMLDWYAYSAGDRPVRVATTYQNVSENWQFELSDDWRGEVTVTKSSSEGMSITTFQEYREADDPIPLLAIYRLTGDMRSYYASRDRMIELAKTKNEIYAAYIPEEAANSKLLLTEESIRGRFAMITQNWSS